VIVLVVLGVWYYGSKPTTSVETGPIKVGFISSLSGEAGVWGQNLKAGFDFALKEINDNGGVNGRKIEVYYDDDKCDATTGVTAFNKAIDVDQVKIITGTVCSSVAMSVAKKTQENGVLYIASGATNPDVPKQGDLIFRLWVSDAYEAKAIAEYATGVLKLKTFGIAHVNDNPAGISLRDEFKSVAESKGGKILGIESFSSKERDYKTYITKLIANKPEALYVVVLPESMPIVINQIRTMGYKGTLLAYSPAMVAEGILDKIKVKDNLYYSTPVDKKETNFWENYRLSAGKDADMLTALGYDSMKVIEAGLSKCGEDNQCIKNYLLSLKDYQSARGKLNFDNYGDLTGVEFQTIRVK
jgi:branched-chain amino acid transport system substrate-binding protein